MIAKFRVERIYEDIQGSLSKKTIHDDLQLNKLSLVITRVTALMGILVSSNDRHGSLTYTTFSLLCVVSKLCFLAIGYCK